LVLPVVATNEIRSRRRAEDRLAAMWHGWVAHMSTSVFARRKPGELPDCRARGHGLATPLLWRDVDQCLVEHPLVPERVIDGGLPLAVLPVVLRINQHRASGHRRLDHAGDVLDLEHHLVRSSVLRRSPSGPNLRDHQLGRLPIRQAELRAMRFADADVFDKSEDLAVPRDSRSYISHRQHGGHASVRRRPVVEHPATLDRSGHPAQNRDGRSSAAGGEVTRVQGRTRGSRRAASHGCGRHEATLRG
jgi:hypothetical protein